MFCSECGKSFPQLAKFCSNCGSKSTSPTKASTIRFSKFRKRKEEERRGKLEPKGKKPKVTTASKKKDVIVNIGVMKYCHGELKKCRGKTLPITTTTDASANQIKEKAVAKHTSHNKSLHDGLEYVLLYPDSSKIVNIPGSNEPFVLEKYREEVGRQYKRITLFISTKSDFLFSKMPKMSNVESESETSSDDEELQKSIYDSSAKGPSSNLRKTAQCLLCNLFGGNI